MKYVLFFIYTFNSSAQNVGLKNLTTVHNESDSQRRFNQNLSQKKSNKITIRKSNPTLIKSKPRTNDCQPVTIDSINNIIDAYNRQVYKLAFE